MSKVKSYTNYLRDQWGEEKYKRFTDFLQWYGESVGDGTQFTFRKSYAISQGMDRAEADELEQFIHAIAHIIQLYGNKLQDYILPTVE